MNAKSWAQADQCGRELRIACARLRAEGMTYDEIAGALRTLPEVVELVLQTPAPLRKCAP